MPFNLTVFFSAMLIVNVYDRLTPRQIGRCGFALCTVALVWLAFVVRNDWSEVPVLLGLILFGIGQGSLVTLLFNVLVTASPKELAGDVGSLRGTTQNLAAAVGTAVAGALLVGLLEHDRARQDHGEPGADAGAPGPGRSRQHHLRQQRPAAQRARTHQRDAAAGRGSRSRQYRGAAAGAEDRTVDHGGSRADRDHSSGDGLPIYLPGEIPGDEVMLQRRELENEQETWKENAMSEMERRDALRLMFGGVIIAGAGVSLWPKDAAALADTSPLDQAASTRREPAGRVYAQSTPATASGAPPASSAAAPAEPSWHRRRRRWVCWWHRGRRHCGWRWH